MRCQKGFFYMAWLNISKIQAGMPILNKNLKQSMFADVKQFLIMPKNPGQNSHSNIVQRQHRWCLYLQYQIYFETSQTCHSGKL